MVSQAGTIAVLRQSMARIEAGLAPASAASGSLASLGATATEAVADPDLTSSSAGTSATSSYFPTSSYLPAPASLNQLLPHGLAMGAVHVVSSAGTLLAAILAEVTRAGQHAAVVGLPNFGFLPVSEQGGDLSRIVCVDNPGSTPLEAISLLVDGVDLVIAHLPQAPAPSLARPLMSRLRKQQAALLFVGESWPGARTRIESELVEVTGVGHGQGRIRTVQYRLRALTKGMPERSVMWTVDERGRSWVGEDASSSAVVSLAERRQAMASSAAGHG